MRALSWATNQLASFQKGCAVGHRPWLHGTNGSRIIAHFCSRDAAATSRMPRLCYVVRSVPWSSGNRRGRKLCELNEPRQARTALRLLRGPTSTAPRHDMGAGLAQRFSDFVCTKSLNAMPPSGCRVRAVNHLQSTWEASCAIRTNHGTRQRVWSVCLRPSLHRATRSRLLRRALQTSRIQPFNGHAIVLSRGPCRGAPAIRVGGRSLRVELFIRPTHVISEVLCRKRSVGRHPRLHGTRWARVLRKRLSGASNITS